MRLLVLILFFSALSPCSAQPTDTVIPKEIISIIQGKVPIDGIYRTREVERFTVSDTIQIVICEVVTEDEWQKANLKGYSLRGCTQLGTITLYSNQTEADNCTGIACSSSGSVQFFGKQRYFAVAIYDCDLALVKADPNYGITAIRSKLKKEVAKYLHM